MNPLDAEEFRRQGQKMIEFTIPNNRKIPCPKSSWMSYLAATELECIVIMDLLLIVLFFPEFIRVFFSY
jgi:hypothetical protein